MSSMDSMVLLERVMASDVRTHNKPPVLCDNHGRLEVAGQRSQVVAEAADSCPERPCSLPMNSYSIAAHFFLLPFFTQLFTVLPPFFFVPRFS